MSSGSTFVRRMVSIGLLLACASSAYTGVAAAEQPATMDPRVSTYAERQAVRDQYAGRIDILTFNDEIGDGVALDQALSDALNAHMTSAASMTR